MTVDGADDLREAMAELNAISQRLRDLARSEGAGWKKEYVAARRDLQNQLVIVDRCGTACFKGIASDLVAEFRATLSRFRHLLSLHQAEWPVVCIAPEDPEYRRSMLGVGEGQEALIRVAGQVMRMCAEKESLKQEFDE